MIPMNDIDKEYDLPCPSNSSRLSSLTKIGLKSLGNVNDLATGGGCSRLYSGIGGSDGDGDGDGDSDGDPTYEASSGE